MDMSHSSGSQPQAFGSPTPTPSGQDVSAGPGGPIKRRAPIACRRCRRMRSKCYHEKSAPCKGCLEAGVPNECVFPTRGDSDADRNFRHPRLRKTPGKSKGDTSSVKRESTTSTGVYDILANVKNLDSDDEWTLLPEIRLVKEGINAFTLHYFQLGFIPKDRFPARVEQRPDSVSVFLLLSILSISARFNKSFEIKYGSGQKACAEFMQRCEMLALEQIYKAPTLERCQAFFLLSIAQQGSGKTSASYINMGIATRMAALLQLHREETYEQVTADSPIEEIIHAESARRTMWMLHSQDNLHSGPYKPVSLANSDITALLPCDENQFRQGIIPKHRAALEGTQPALRDPRLTLLPNRSLFATLIQGHYLWGIVARRAISNEKITNPEIYNSDYTELINKLDSFERSLPFEHRFNDKMLKGYRLDHEDLAYFGCCTSVRLCYIVLRKPHMHELIRILRRSPSDPAVSLHQQRTLELFKDVRQLYQVVHAQYENDNRTPEEMIGSQMATFLVYTCGHLAAYLYKFPQLIAQGGLEPIRMEGKVMYERTVSILEQCTAFWPVALTWLNDLKKWYEDPSTNASAFHGGTMTDGEPQPYALLHPPMAISSWDAKMMNFYPHRPASASTIDKDVSSGKPEPAQLAPLQPAQSPYDPPPSLPSLLPYSHHQHASPPSHHGAQHAHSYYSHEGYHPLHEAGHSSTPTTDPYPQSYISDFAMSMGDDGGFQANLHNFVDSNWSPHNSAILYGYSMHDELGHSD